MDINIIITVVSVVSILLSVPFLVGALYYLSCYLGFRNGKTDVVYGELVKTEYRKNVYKRGRGWYKHYTNFAYKYKVDGKEYLVSGSDPLRPHNLSRIEKIVYQTKYPKRAYIPKYDNYRDNIIVIIALFIIFFMFLAAGCLIWI